MSTPILPRPNEKCALSSRAIMRHLMRQWRAFKGSVLARLKHAPSGCRTSSPLGRRRSSFALVGRISSGNSSAVPGKCCHRCNEGEGEGKVRGSGGGEFMPSVRLLEQHEFPPELQTAFHFT